MTHKQDVSLATEIQFALDDILRKNLKCIGVVSHSICYDIVVHQSHDMDRLYAVHQKLVHPTKHVGYLAFWVRKLKPVSSAYQISVVETAMTKGIQVEPFEEIGDINEQISLHYALELLITYIRSGQIVPPKGVSAEKFITKIRFCFCQYLDAEVDENPSLSNRFDTIVYDMRFRTFGPHHVVHIMNHLLREAES